MTDRSHTTHSLHPLHLRKGTHPADCTGQHQRDQTERTAQPARLGAPAVFSLHAGVACKSTQPKKLERLCRYITRPAIAEQRLSLASNGNVIVGLKTAYDDGTTHVVLSPMEFIGRLAALVPKPRVNLTRFHGVFSSNSKLRKQVVPRKPVEREPRQKPKAYGMIWAQRLKRVLKGRPSALK